MYEEEFNGANFTALVNALVTELGLEGIKVSLYVVMQKDNNLK